MPFDDFKAGISRIVDQECPLDRPLDLGEINTKAHHYVITKIRALKNTAIKPPILDIPYETDAQQAFVDKLDEKLTALAARSEKFSPAATRG